MVCGYTLFEHYDYREGFMASLSKGVTVTALIMCTAATCVARAAKQHSSAALAPAMSRLGMNLAGLADWSTEFPFVDVLRLSRKWISQRKGTPWGKGPELERDANGWIKRLEPDCWADTPLLTESHGHAPAGDYVCLYDGEGTIDFSNSKIVSRQPGRMVVKIDTSRGGTFLSLRSTNPANYVRNIRVIMPGFEDSYRSEPRHQ